MYEKLHNIRKSNKVTCEQLSHILGLKTRAAYHKKEIGSVPFILEAKLIVAYFDAKIEDIF